MARHAFYRFFVGDYLRDAGHLSLLEHGAYRRLIDLYMIEGAPIAFDLSRLYRLLHATSKEEQQAVQTVIEEFFVIDGIDRGKLRHKRCDREISWQDSLTEAAKAKAKARWSEQKQALTSSGTADALQQQYRGNASQSQSQSHKKKKIPSPTSPDWQCPAGVTVEAWTAWLEVRKRLHSPMTEFAYKRALSQIEAWSTAGHDPDAIVSASASNGWKGLFEPKEKPVPDGPKDGDKRIDKWGEATFHDGDWHY